MTNRQIALLAASIRRSTRPSWSADTPEYVLQEADEYVAWLEGCNTPDEIKPLRFNHFTGKP